MKRALVFGGGSKNCKPIIDSLSERNYHTINVGSSHHESAENIIVDWKDLDLLKVHDICKQMSEVDFVFFNHNASSLSQHNFNTDHNDTLEVWKLVKDWSHSHWLSVQMPFVVIHSLRHKLNVDAKIGWMLSGHVNYQKPGIQEHPDYSANKFFNLLSCECFGLENSYYTFGVYPSFAESGSRLRLKQTIDDVLDDKSEQQRHFHI